MNDEIKDGAFRSMIDQNSQEKDVSTNDNPDNSGIRFLDIDGFSDNEKEEVEKEPDITSTDHTENEPNEGSEATEPAEEPAEPEPVQEEQAAREPQVKQQARTPRAPRNRGAASLSKTFRNKRGPVRISSETPEKTMSPFKQAAAELMNSKTQHQPVTVKMTGIEPMYPAGSKRSVMTPVCFYKGWKIYIPREEFLPPYSLTAEERGDEEEINKRLNWYQGAEVDIIPTSFFSDMKIVVASRVQAMEVKKNQYWFAKNVVRRGHQTVERDLLREGSRVEARIVHVARTLLTIEIFGVESRIPIEEVSYSRLQDLRTKYECGDTTFVRITKLIRSDDTRDVRFEASIKQAYPNPREAAFQMYKKNGIYDGYVVMIKTDPEKGERSGAFVVLKDGDEEIDILCNYPKDKLVEIGDKVRVGITMKNENSLRMFGNILHVYPPKSN